MSTADVKQAARAANRKASSRKKGTTTIKGIPVFSDGGFDVFYFILVFLLLTIGLVMLFSASYVTAKYGGSETNNDPLYFIKKQLIYAVGGIIVMFVFSKINPKIFKALTPIISAASGALLVLVLIFPYRIPGKEEIKRWLRIPIVKITFQPSDIAKFALILGLAYLIDRYRKKIEKDWRYSLMLFGVVAAVCGLVFLEHHLSCTILMFLVGIGMIFLGGIDRRWFIFGIGFGILAAFAIYALRNKIFDDYQLKRIESFFDKDYDNKEGRWQTNQSLFALGSGGIFGRGLGNSIQKHLFMPEPENDFIFAIVGEELGFLRCVFIILLFAALVLRGFSIATKTKTLFERLVVLGVSLQIGLQTILNILVVTDMVPNTGIALPFFSYGGTALIIQLAEVGVVLSISRSGNRNKVVKKNAGSEQ